MIHSIIEGDVSSVVASLPLKAIAHYGHNPIGDRIGRLPDRFRRQYSRRWRQRLSPISLLMSCSMRLTLLMDLALSSSHRTNSDSETDFSGCTAPRFRASSNRRCALGSRLVRTLPTGEETQRQTGLARRTGSSISMTSQGARNGRVESLFMLATSPRPRSDPRLQRKPNPP